MQQSDISRRALLVNIGAAVTFALPGNAAPSLPPGLYDPSTDHLGHALMSSGRFHPIPAGSPTDYVRPATGSFTPVFFSRAGFSVIQRLVELVLGDKTCAQEVTGWIDLRIASAASVREAARHLDPLHRVLAVAYYGPAHAVQLETEDPARICREGTVWLANAARSLGSDQFVSLREEQQVAILDSISDERPERQSENAGARLFALLKTEVIRGYYTSQAGLKELDFKGNAFYARSPGCNSKPK